MLEAVVLGNRRHDPPPRRAIRLCVVLPDNRRVEGFSQNTVRVLILAGAHEGLCPVPSVGALGMAQAMGRVRGVLCWSSACVEHAE
jgi:hypothetical protein